MPEPTTPPACPICGKPVAGDAPTRPFCCVRCKMVDLGRWFTERYRVPGTETVLPEALEDEPFDKEPDPGT